MHQLHGGPLPQLPTVVLEENVAEKSARLNGRTQGRDAFDRHGLTSSAHAWSPIYGARPFDPERRLRFRSRSDFDDEQIGLLTTPPPDLVDLESRLGAYDPWLADLDADELIFGGDSRGDRATVLRMLAELDGGRLASECW